MRKAFTLIEVNLAMLIMAGGILSIVGLYAFGFRESKQSRDDVAAASIADAFMSPIVMALSATNVPWTAFRDLPDFPGDRGWGEFIDQRTGLVKSDPYRSINSYLGKLKIPSEAYGDLSQAQAALASAGMTCGIVIMHDKYSAVATVAFRAVDKNKIGTLMSMPLFLTEVRFQGVPDK